MLKLYIDIDDGQGWTDIPTWWRNFNKTISDNNVLRPTAFIKIKNRALGPHSATLNYTKDYKRYLEFSDERKMTMFLLKYS